MELSLGQKIKEIRIHYKLSPADFAKKLGFSERACSSYEYDERKPPYEFYFNMHTVYNVNLNWLIANQGDKFILPKYEDIEEDLTQKVESILRKYELI